MEDISLPSTASLIKKYQLRADKTLGQNFLIDNTLTDKIVKSVDNITEKNIVEIGPGPGCLTRSLLMSKAKQIYVIEKDQRFIPLLEEIKQLFPNRLTIIHHDALKINLTEHVPDKFHIVANLPYNIATKLLLNWLNYSLKNILSLTLMFQKEVALRITAQLGQEYYGRLAIISNLLCETELLFNISAKAFVPHPKVTSSVIKLTPHKKLPFSVNINDLQELTQSLFSQRRKTLRNSLKKKLDNPELFFKKLNINSNLRPENLSIEEFCMISNYLSSYK